MRRQKYQAKFPVARIKRLVQKDKNIGKISLLTPYILSKSIECFLDDMANLVSQHVKHIGEFRIQNKHVAFVVQKYPRLAFMNQLVLDALRSSLSISASTPTTTSVTPPSVPTPTDMTEITTPPSSSSTPIENLMTINPINNHDLVSPNLISDMNKSNAKIPSRNLRNSIKEDEEKADGDSEDNNNDNEHISSSVRRVKNPKSFSKSSTSSTVSKRKTSTAYEGIEKTSLNKKKSKIPSDLSDSSTFAESSSMSSLKSMNRGRKKKSVSQITELSKHDDIPMSYCNNISSDINNMNAGINNNYNSYNANTDTDLTAESKLIPSFVAPTRTSSTNGTNFETQENNDLYSHHKNTPDDPLSSLFSKETIFQSMKINGLNQTGPDDGDDDYDA